MKMPTILITIATSLLLMGCQVELAPLDSAADNSATNPITSNYAEESRRDEPTIGTTVTSNTTPADTTPRDKAITLSWKAPVERENSESLHLHDIGGYVVEYRKQTDAGVNIETVIVPAKSAHESVKVTNLENAAYEVRVAAFDTNGLYSEFTDYAVVMAN